MKIKGLRWWVIALIALATVINYIDRQTMNVLWAASMGEELYPDLMIEGANAPTYLVTEGDVGEALRVHGTYTNDEGEEVVLTSMPTDSVLVEPQDVEESAETETDEEANEDPHLVVQGDPLVGEILAVELVNVEEIGLEDLDISWAVAPVDYRKKILGIISGFFILAYALGQALFGKIFDWIGTRLGFALSITVWSIATALHAFGQGVVSLSIFRGLLGAAEAGNWPGAAKGNAEWFPIKERALAQGIFNSGAAIGGLISIPLIAFLAIYLSWQIIFVLVGVLGLLWLIPWMILVKSPPKQHPWITDEEREYILTGQKVSSLNDSSEDIADEGYNPSTGEMLTRKQSWGVIIASAAIDPIWWLFIIWIPTYLIEVHGMDVKGIAITGWVPYMGAMLGAWFGGLLSQNRFKAGWSVDKIRKLVITLGCLIMLPSLLALSNPGNAITAVLIMAVILFGFQTAIGSVQTLPADFLGQKSVGTLAGFAGMAAKFTAWGLTVFVPWLTAGGNYAPAFVIGAALSVTAMLAVWILCPKIEPLKPKA